MEITTQFAVLVPIVIALTQMIKGTGLSTRFAPVVSLVLGVLSTLVVGQFDLLQGLMVGLTASGLFSGGKAITQ